MFKQWFQEVFEDKTFFSIIMEFKKDMSRELKKSGVSFKKKKDNVCILSIEYDRYTYIRELKETFIRVLNLPDWEVKRVWDKKDGSAYGKYLKQLPPEEQIGIIYRSISKNDQQNFEELFPNTICLSIQYADPFNNDY